MYDGSHERFNGSKVIQSVKSIAKNPIPSPPNVDVVVTYGPPKGILDEGVGQARDARVSSWLWAEPDHACAVLSTFTEAQRRSDRLEVSIGWSIWPIDHRPRKSSRARTHPQCIPRAGKAFITPWTLIAHGQCCYHGWEK